MNNKELLNYFTNNLIDKHRLLIIEKEEIEIEKEELEIENQELRKQLINREERYNEPIYHTRENDMEELKDFSDDSDSEDDDSCYDNDINNPVSKKNIEKIICSFIPFLKNVYKHNGNELPLEIERNNKKAIFLKTMGIISLVFSDDFEKNIRHFKEKPKMHFKPHIEKLIGN